MKYLSLTVFAAISSVASAQVEIDKPIELTGGDGDRSVKNLELPVNPNDAANKAYVDAAIASLGGSTAPKNCQAILQANPGSPDGIYQIDPDESGGEFQPFPVYCDMTSDGGGWTLVYRDNLDGGMQVGNPIDIGDLSSLTSLSGPSAKLSDRKINSIKSSSSEAIAFRTTSPDIGNRYYHPGSCEYQHNSNYNNGVPLNCARYIASYTSSPSPSYIQCENWGGYAGGINCWYNCGGPTGYSNVVITHRGYTERSGITTNASGSSLGGPSDPYLRKLLLWVR